MLEQSSANQSLLIRRRYSESVREQAAWNASDGGCLKTPNGASPTGI